MKFKTSYYSESIEYPKSEDFIKVSQEAIDQIQKVGFSSVDIFWRGFKKKRIAAPVLRVSGERENFYGGLAEIPTKIIKGLKIKSPAFTSRTTIVRFFGQPMIFVPMKPFKAWQSPIVDDLMEIKDDSDLDKVIKSYKNTIKKISEDEIIFDVKNYLLIDPGQLLFTMGRKDDIKKIKTYKDATKLLLEYIAYIKRTK